MFKVLNGGAQTAFVIIAMLQISEASDDFGIAAEEYVNAEPYSYPRFIARGKMDAAMQKIVQAADPTVVASFIVKKAIDGKFIKDLCELSSY